MELNGFIKENILIKNELETKTKELDKLNSILNEYNNNK